MEKYLLYVSMVLLSIVSFMHLGRLLWAIELTIAGKSVPLWVSGVGFVVPLLLVFGLAKVLKKFS